MKIKKRSLKLQMVIGIVIVCIGLGFIAYKAGKKIETVSTNNAGIPMTVQTVNDETALYKIQAEYPSFDATLDRLNKEVEKTVSSRVEEFKTQAAQNWEDMKQFRSSGEATSAYPESPYTFFVNWTSQQITRSYVSFVINIEWYTGGANMAQDSVTFNWNVRKNTPVFLADVFSGKSDYLARISAYTRSDLKKQFMAQGTEERYIAEDMLIQGTTPTVENFSRFTFDDTTITFYFPKYQVAPGASGPQKVVMPR